MDINLESIVMIRYLCIESKLECKYTGYVNVVSRPTFARPRLSHLAAELQKMEELENEKRKEVLSYELIANVLTDSGPMLRLEPIGGKRLSKAERYGHPFERPIYASKLKEDVVVSVVKSFFARIAEKCGGPKIGWQWETILQANRDAKWDEWKDTHHTAAA